MPTLSRQMKIRLNLAASEAPLPPSPRKARSRRSGCFLLISFALGFCSRGEVLQSGADKKPRRVLRRARGGAAARLSRGYPGRSWGAAPRVYHFWVFEQRLIVLLRCHGFQTRALRGRCFLRRLSLKFNLNSCLCIWTSKLIDRW